MISKIKYFLQNHWKKFAVIVGFILIWNILGWLNDAILNVKPFAKKVVLITGTASGMGKATAEHLLKQGYIVYGGDIQYEKNKYLNKIGGHALDMDVTSINMVMAGVSKVIQEQGRIDVLFNNAGYGLYGPVEEVSMEDVRAQFDVNVFGYAHLVKAVLPHMRKQGNGLIINNTSMGGRIYTPLGAWYHASKYALEGWSDALRFEVNHFGVDVAIIEPGAINTNFGTPVRNFLKKYRPGTAYEHIFAPFDAMMANTDTSSMGADPIIIAKTVEKAIRSKTPKTRYLVGPMAKPLVFFRKVLGDRGYDWLMKRMFGG